MSTIIPVSFKCKNCGGVMTLGVEGGREALDSPPPSCLYCRCTELEDTDEHLQLPKEEELS